MSKPGKVYDLSKQADYDEFVRDYGPSLAKATRFALAYGFNYTPKQLRATANAHSMTEEQYAKLEAAFASQGLIK